MFLLLALLALVWFLSDPVGFLAVLFCCACIALAAVVTLATIGAAWVVLS